MRLPGKTLQQSVDIETVGQRSSGVAAGWFLLQHGVGLGRAASKTPKPWKVRGLGLVAHTAFGLDMLGGALVA